MKQKKNKKRGMTIIGVLIGITILTIALAAQIRLLSNTIKRQAYLKNAMIATNLAREGIEIAFLARNTLGWDNLKARIGKDFCTDIASITTLFLKEGSACSSTPLSYAIKENFRGFYYTNTADSIVTDLSIPSYYRKIKIDHCDPVSDEECLTLKSEVSWENETISLEKKVYNWYIP